MTNVQAKQQDFKWVSSQSVKDHPNPYTVLTVDISKIVKSWRQSIIAHEWLDQGTHFRDVEHLSFHLRRQWEETLANIESGQDLERPILGIGIIDNVEIGTNRAIISVARTLGWKTIEVVVPEKMVDLFEEFKV